MAQEYLLPRKSQQHNSLRFKNIDGLLGSNWRFGGGISWFQSEFKILRMHSAKAAAAAVAKDDEDHREQYRK